MSRKTILIIGIVATVCITLIFIVLSAFGITSFVRYHFIDIYYETSDISDYGIYIGNYDNDSPTIFINRFFPERIDPSFENVRYSYRARKGDTYGYEAYLEFSISDESAYAEYVDSIVDRSQLTAFPYDPHYQEFVINDLLNLQPSNRNSPEENDYHIRTAQIGKILINENQNNIIFVAVGVYDGGLTTTGYLNEYFSRFDIDPSEYEKGRSYADGKRIDD